MLNQGPDSFNIDNYFYELEYRGWFFFLAYEKIGAVFMSQWEDRSCFLWANEKTWQFLWAYEKSCLYEPMRRQELFPLANEKTGAVSMSKWEDWNYFREPTRRMELFPWANEKNGVVSMSQWEYRSCFHEPMRRQGLFSWANETTGANEFLKLSLGDVCGTQVLLVVGGCHMMTHWKKKDKMINTLRLRQNGHHIADNIVKCISK